MRVQVLDHGFVRLVELWGLGDCMREDFEIGIIEAARQSTQGSFRGWGQDFRLLKYLYENKHATPFEFAGMVIEVRAPLFVFREWHRHRTQSYNEMSARYEKLPDLYYVPSLERLIDGSKPTVNKQASSSKVLSREEAELFQSTLSANCDNFAVQYQSDLEKGVPKELARCGMPVNWYSQMRASTCLRNWLGFLTLRMDPAAQWEIRQYANAVAKIVEEYFPKTYQLFQESRER